MGVILVWDVRLCVLGGRNGQVRFSVGTKVDRHRKLTLFVGPGYLGIV